MDRFHNQKFYNFSRPKSTPNVVSARRTPSQENLHLWRQAEALDILSDTSSCSGYSTEEDSFSYKLRRSGLNRSSEAPIKKLLAEELSKEMEPKRRPPSVIGRLMGLDTLPPQQPVKKPEKKFSDSYLKKTASIGYIDKRSAYDGRLQRKRSKEQQEFKDVYEVLETSTLEKLEKRPDLEIQKRMTMSELNETKMEYVRQKFLDVKRLSTDEKLQQSKEFHDALEVLDSNKDLLLKFLQEPDSLFTKHLRDLHSVPSPPHPGHIKVLKSSNGRGNLHRKSDRKTEQTDVVSPFQKHEQDAISHSRRKNVYIPSKVSKSHVQESNATCHLPTRIVVLKPNLKKVQNTVRSVSSPDSSGGFPSGHRKNKEFGSSEGLELYEEVRHRRDSSFELEVMKHTTRGSREIAKEITRQMRDSVSSGSKMVPYSRVRGYAEDESSYHMSGNDSGSEYEVKTPTSRHFNDWKSRYSPSTSYSAESSVSREAKKRLSERWKMTHRSQEAGRVSRGSTLGEMLAMPEKETGLITSDSIVSPAGFSDRLSKNGDVTRCVSPLGISSRDGWKDECIRSLPRSRSLPASSTRLSSPKRSTRYGSVGKDEWSLPKDTGNRRSNSSKNVDSERREGFFSRSNSKPSRKKSSYSFGADGEKSHPVQDSDLKPDERMRVDGGMSPSELDVVIKPDELSLNFEEVDLSEGKPSTRDIPVDDVPHVATSANDQESPSGNSNPENASVVPTEGSSICSPRTITEVQSPTSSKEAGQPSPVSVLELPFVEESPSSSDSFEKISADLHGLRMQLQLLKLESSDGYSEGSEMIVSSDEDVTERSGSLLRDDRGLNGIIMGNKVNKDFSYVVDILADSGFHDVDLDVLLETWYSPELPVAPSVFDKLEKKYGEQISWPRSERKLLFDRINLGLIELLQPHNDPHPWVKFGETLGPKWNGEQIVEELCNLLVRQNVELGKDGLGTALIKAMNWFDLGDDIDAIGNEIGRFIFDELVSEVVGSLVIT